MSISVESMDELTDDYHMIKELNKEIDCLHNIKDKHLDEHINSVCKQIIDCNNSSINNFENCEQNLKSFNENLENDKSDVNLVLKTDLSVNDLPKTTVKQKYKKITQLKNEYEILKNELLMANKLIDVLMKFKSYLTDNLLRQNVTNVETDEQLKLLNSEYNNVLNEKQAIDKINDEIKFKNEKQLKVRLRVSNRVKLPPIVSNDKINNKKLEPVMRKKKRKWLCNFDLKRTKLLNDQTLHSDSSETHRKFTANNYKRRRGRPRKDETGKCDAVSNASLVPTISTNCISVSKKSKSSFRCSWPGCGYECSRTKMLNEHINSAHTGNRPYECPIADCCKSFARSNTLDVHLKSCHSDLRKYKCTWPGCDASLKTKLGLSIHLQRHSGEKQFKCDWPGCSYRGMTKQRLEIHIMNHTGERPYKCTWPGCEANFTSSDCLRSHQKSHSDNRPFKCDWPGCDSAFKANRALTIHKVIHTNEKVFKCIWPGCEFRCNRYHILASHRLNHTGGKKFACSWPGCESKFDRRNKLEMHLMIHRGDKPHKCDWPGCEKRFVEKGNMRKHYNSVHTKL